MVSTVLARKLRRDLWRNRWQFSAAALVIAIGVAVYVGAADAYVNLDESFSRAYAVQRLPDATLSGSGAVALRDEAAGLPGRPVVTVRRQGDVGIRIGDHTLVGRAVGVPTQQQPEVSRLALQSGRLPRRGEVVVEQHLADHFHLEPGDRVALLAPDDWRTFRVSGSALSTEYLWPARSRQEIMTTPEHFGVVFATAPDIRRVVAEPVDQLLLYTADRDRAPALEQAASSLAGERGLLFMSREEQPSYRALREDVDGFGEMARLLPWVFLVAGVLGTYVLLSRLVTSQRAIIGTFAANGFPARTLRRHYLGYGVAAGLLGVVPGLVGGWFVGRWFTNAYTTSLSVPVAVTSLHPRTLLVGAVGAVVAAAAAAWVPAGAAARMSPAEAMRVAPSGGTGGRSLLERAVPPLRRLPARWRMTLRGITRNRRRSAMTVVGVAVSVGLVMTFAGLRDTVDGLIARQFDSIQLQDAEVHVAPGTAPTALGRIRAEPGVAAAEPFARYDVTLTGPQGHLLTLLTAMAPDTTMHRFTDADGNPLVLPDDSVLLGIGARNELGVEVGDPVEVSIAASGQRLTRRLAGFVDEPMSPVAYTSLAGLGDVHSPPSASGVLVRVTSDADAEEVADRLSATPGVVAVLTTDTLEQAMTETFGLYHALVSLMLTFAALMAAALLYNAMSANAAERAVELGTLRAAGMRGGMLGRLVATESMLLVAVAVPLGLAVGAWLADWFLGRYETEGYYWSLTLDPSTPLVVAGTILAVALLVQLPAGRTVRRMDLPRIVRERSL
ncbi:ABC transporter permease [Nocardioides guangzhouensis]|uniref:ABC transporter permease n=1 Tax=Nocardioides guangzhouensis TaxID=2497878 RepID=A0A4Q4ZDY9_9ACTN|nr:FtsX-like permease family protein [Nocardioides guangzhouensis]RYP85865.1 ABC transporter permease [Nocardioides guangzhouensis]